MCIHTPYLPVPVSRGGGQEACQISSGSLLRHITTPTARTPRSPPLLLLRSGIHAQCEHRDSGTVERGLHPTDMTLMACATVPKVAQGSSSAKAILSAGPGLCSRSSEWRSETCHAHCQSNPLACGLYCHAGQRLARWRGE